MCDEQEHVIGLTYRTGDRSRGVRVRAADATLDRSALRFDVTVPARGRWSTTVLVNPVVDGDEVPQPFPIDRPTGLSTPVRRLAEWDERSPVVQSDDAQLVRTLERSRRGPRRAAHLRTRSIPTDRRRRRRAVVHDRLRARLPAHGVDGSARRPVLALGMLRTLARLPGQRGRPDDRGGARARSSTRCASASTGGWPAAGGRLLRLGRRHPAVRHAARRAAALGPRPRRGRRGCCRTPTGRSTGSSDFGDRDGDGYVEYQRAHRPRASPTRAGRTPGTAIRFADGRLAEPPIALCEVQGYVYAAYLARAHFAEEAGDRRRGRALRAEAARLCGGVQRATSGSPERGWFALGLDARQAADRRPGLEHGPLPVDRHRRSRQGRRWSPSGCCHPRCSPAGASARWPPRWAPTTRSATTTARCGRTTTPSSPPG